MGYACKVYVSIASRAQAATVGVQMVSKERKNGCRGTDFALA